MTTQHNLKRRLLLVLHVGPWAHTCGNKHTHITCGSAMAGHRKVTAGVIRGYWAIGAHQIPVVFVTHGTEYWCVCSLPLEGGPKPTFCSPARPHCVFGMAGRAGRWGVSLQCCRQGRPRVFQKSGPTTACSAHLVCSANSRPTLNFSPPPPKPQCAWSMTNRRQWVGGELTQTAEDTFDGHTRAVNSRQHSALVWFALRCSKAQQCTEAMTMCL